MSPDLTKVVVTRSGRLDPGLRFFTEGAGVPKVVIAAEEADRASLRRLEGVARVIVLPWVTARGILDALEAEGICSCWSRGVRRSCGCSSVRMRSMNCGWRLPR